MVETKSILVVEDDQPLGEVISAALQREGYEITIATRGKDAVNALSSEGVDMVICDVVLPDMNGLDLLAWSKNHLGDQLPLFLLLSGKDLSEQELNKSFQVGAVDFIRKPFSMGDLTRRVNSFFRILLLEKEKKSSEALKEASRKDETDAWVRLAVEKVALTKSVYEESVFLFQKHQVVEEISKLYKSLIEKAVNGRIYKTDVDLKDDLIKLAGWFGFYYATPRDVIKIHKEIFDDLIDQENLKKVTMILEESRIVLLELIGYLASYYRNRCSKI